MASAAELQPSRRPPTMTDPRPVGGAPYAAFRAQVTTVDGVTVLTLAGELDLAARRRMDGALSDVPGGLGRLVVDVSALTFMDAAGLGLLIAAHSLLVPARREGLLVRGASGIVRRVFEITGLSSMLDDSKPDLERARRDSGLGMKDLFVAYFALGGTADLAELAADLGGEAPLDDHQHDIVVHALNEHLVDLGRRECLLAYDADRRLERAG